MVDPGGPHVTHYPMVAARWRRRAWVAAILAGVGLIGLVVAGLAFVGGGSSGPQAGDCAAHGEGDSLRMVGCDSPDAFGRVVKLTPEEAFGARQSDCPEEADSFGRLRRQGQPLAKIACIRNLAPPHPGDPGAGGGLLRAGDCIEGGLFLREVACSADAGGHVAARVATEGDCPPGTLDVVTGADDPRPVLCLDSGKDVLAPGDCIADPEAPFAALGSPKVACASESRFATVLARAPSPTACPPATRLTLTTESGTAQSRIICLR